MNAEMLGTALVVFIGAFIAEPILLFFVRLLGLYTTVQERTCKVYMLFGKVLGTISEPGFHFLPAVLGPAAFIARWLGTCHVLDMRLDQEYLRSQPVNSEEGAPMGIGIWYEMWISDPVAYLFKNTDPRGSLRANVRDARNAAQDEPDGAHRGDGQVAGVGLSVGLGLHPQSAFPGCRDDPADRGKSGEPPSPGDVGDQAGRRQPGERDHQFR
jgi:hypothetical protein